MNRNQNLPTAKRIHFSPSQRRGLFFQDSFFDDIQKQFETAIDQILDAWGEAKSVSDLMSSYRQVRERNLQQENQVMAFSEDDQNHKEEGDFKSMKSFCRRFNFPGKVDMEAVTSAMSSDGVMTITAPKIPQAA
ncbi:heat shock protein 22-like [Penaeus monodon]|uniref:heat shock protein 22-like n=1 Tax=Penaeus monodon TaxID=6687 RepID=UPI0018A75968|nr:heat shock protein 22-like [Penaeus monodon]